MAAKGSGQARSGPNAGDALSDFFRMLLVDALMHAAVRDETMVFQVEAIEEHSQEQAFRVETGSPVAA